MTGFYNKKDYVVTRKNGYNKLAQCALDERRMFLMRVGEKNPTPEDAGDGTEGCSPCALISEEPVHNIIIKETGISIKITREPK